MYKLDKHTLQYIKIKPNWYKQYIIASIATSIIIIGSSITFKKLDDKTVEAKVLVILSKENQFSKDKFISKLKDMNFMFPHIVYAQSLLETNSFTSPVFKENNNLFGMKEASIRITTSNGTQNNYATYINWLNSLYDYGYYQATYLSKLQTEDDYFSYLNQYYAEDSKYISKIKSIIETNHLKELFNK